MSQPSLLLLVLRCVTLCGALVVPVLAQAETPSAPAANTEPAPSGTASETAPPVPVKPVIVKRADVIVRQLSNLEFGTFAIEQGSGSITISPTNARTTTGNVSMLNTGITGAAEFEVIGQPGEIVTIFLPDRVTLGKGGGSGGMTITNLTSIPNDTATLDTQGHARIKVGGTLQVSGNLSSGSYSGAFDIDVRYLR